MQVTKFMLPAGIMNFAATCRKISDLEVKNAMINSCSHLEVVNELVKVYVHF